MQELLEAMKKREYARVDLLEALDRQRQLLNYYRKMGILNEKSYYKEIENV